MNSTPNYFYVVDRSDPWEQFFFILSWIFLISIVLFAFCGSILDIYKNEIIKLQSYNADLSRQLKTYQLANEFSEEYGINIVSSNPGRALSIAKVTRDFYCRALKDIAIRYNPTLTKRQAIDLSDTIYEEALRYDFNPLEVAAVIVQESEFKTDAESDAGAIGLMQVMPGTGKELAESYGIKWEGIKTLYDPIINIKLGTYYLWDLRRSYPSSYLIGYNGGPGAIHKVNAGYEFKEVLVYHRSVTSRFSNLQYRYNREFLTWVN
jgi:soluble lytic murein transglycosylase-like protein